MKSRNSKTHANRPRHGLAPWLAAWLTVAVCAPAVADGPALAGYDSARPDGHAPIGVMGEHMPHRGEWMLACRYMTMHMEGLRTGTDSLTTREAFARGLAMVPAEMDTDRHMPGAMPAGAGARSRSTDGWGDTVLSARIRLRETAGHGIHAGLRVGLPTAHVEQKHVGVYLPYGIQLERDHSLVLGWQKAW